MGYSSFPDPTGMKRTIYDVDENGVADEVDSVNGVDAATLTGDVSANTAARHTHANKAQLDLVSDGDHDIRTDNPHGVTPAQIGAARVVEGTYTGDGTLSQAITGLGITVQFLKIWERETGDDAKIDFFETSTEIIDDNGSGQSLNLEKRKTVTGAIVSLDADGFTVGDKGGDDHPNKSGIIYNFYAVGS